MFTRIHSYYFSLIVYKWMYIKNLEKQTKGQLFSSFTAEEISILTHRPAQTHNQTHIQTHLHQSPFTHTHMHISMVWLVSAPFTSLLSCWGRFNPLQSLVGNTGERYRVITSPRYEQRSIQHNISPFRILSQWGRGID